MIAAAGEHVTAAEYRALPETGRPCQLIEGDLYMAPAPNRFHQDISRNIELRIAIYLETHPIGILYDAPFDVYLNNENVFQPDLVFIARENYRVLTDAGVEGAPDLVIEILSARTAQLDRHAKRRVYAEAGVKELWLVDPEAMNVTVFLLQHHATQAAAVYHMTDRFSSNFLPGLVFEVAGFFQRPALGHVEE
jgi:Uma2 family endonuclease